MAKDLSAEDERVEERVKVSSSVDGQLSRAVVDVPNGVDLVLVLGVEDRNLRTLEEHFSRVSFWVKDRTIHLQGVGEQVSDAVQACNELIDQAIGSNRRGKPKLGVYDPAGVSFEGGSAAGSAGYYPGFFGGDQRPLGETILVTPRGKTIGALTEGQSRYVDMIKANTITFAIGPAGTGKTYLAMAHAVTALLQGSVSRLVLTRPAVEAGESLGFLPGTLFDKIDPYLRPLYDALREMIDKSLLPNLLEAGTVEVAPLAYMRGRTLNDAFIILDEAQNTTSEQMKMFLTRLGEGSKIVVTGDITQVDLPRGRDSGLVSLRQILREVPGVGFCTLDSGDVVRHSLVAKIVEAYARFDEQMARKKDDGTFHKH